MNKISTFLIFLLIFSVHKIKAQYFERIYSGLQLQSVGSIDNTLDDGFIFCGSKSGGFLMKLNSAGDSMWSVTDTGNIDIAAAVIQDASGNFLVTGSIPFQQYNSVAAVSRFDSSGAFMSNILIPPVDGWGTWGIGVARSDDRLSTHFFYYSDGLTASNYIYLDNGDVIAGDNTRMNCNSVSINNNGDYFASGNLAFDLDSLFNWRNNVLVLTSSGVPLSQHFYDTDIASNVMTPDGGVAVAGVYDSLGVKLVRLLKFGVNRSLLHDAFLPVSDVVSVEDIDRTSDGGFVLLCSRNDGIPHIALIKTDSLGSLLWLEKFYGNGGAAPANFRVLNDGFVILGLTGNDAYVIRTDYLGRTNTTGITGPENRFVNVYPVPTTGILNIATEGIYSDALQFSAFDFTGREVYRAKLNASREQYDLSFLPPGVYLFRLQSPGGEQICGKFVIE